MKLVIVCSSCMVTKFKKYPGLVFALKCAVAGGLIMFLCMAAGEIFVRPDLFRGMLQRPRIWPLIFVESAAWLLPFMLVVLPAIHRLRYLPAATARAIIILGWILVGSTIVIGYKMTYYPDNWALEQLKRPDITFGWTLPCSFILGTFVLFSLQYLRQIRSSILTCENS